MKHFTCKVFFVFPNAFLINWISQNSAGSPQETSGSGQYVRSALHHFTFRKTYQTYSDSQSRGNIVNIFHGIFSTSQTCHNFNRETSRICFIKILEHFRIFLDENRALDVLPSRFYEPARKMLDSSENLHGSSCVFSEPNLVMFCLLCTLNWTLLACLKIPRAAAISSSRFTLKHYLAKVLGKVGFGFFQCSPPFLVIWIWGKLLKMKISVFWQRQKEFHAETFMKLYISPSQFSHSGLRCEWSLWLRPTAQDLFF